MKNRIENIQFGFTVNNTDLNAAVCVGHMCPGVWMDTPTNKRQNKHLNNEYGLNHFEYFMVYTPWPGKLARTRFFPWTRIFWDTEDTEGNMKSVLWSDIVSWLQIASWPQRVVSNLGWGNQQAWNLPGPGFTVIQGTHGPSGSQWSWYS